MAQFRVRCQRAAGAPFFNVLIFADKAAMNIYYRAQQEKLGDEATCDFDAITCSWTIQAIRPDGTEKKKPHMGVILFYRQRLGVGIVSHEMTHAAIRWGYRVGLRLDEAEDADGAREERVAWVQGYLVTQFWRAFYRLRLGREGR